MQLSQLKLLVLLSVYFGSVLLVALHLAFRVIHQLQDIKTNWYIEENIRNPDLEFHLNHHHEPSAQHSVQMNKDNLRILPKTPHGQQQDENVNEDEVMIFQHISDNVGKNVDNFNHHSPCPDEHKSFEVPGVLVKRLFKALMYHKNHDSEKRHLIQQLQSLSQSNRMLAILNIKLHVEYVRRKLAIELLIGLIQLISACCTFFAFNSGRRTTIGLAMILTLSVYFGFLTQGGWNEHRGQPGAMLALVIQIICIVLMMFVIKKRNADQINNQNLPVHNCYMTDGNVQWFISTPNDVVDNKNKKCAELFSSMYEDVCKPESKSSFQSMTNEKKSDK